MASPLRAHRRALTISAAAVAAAAAAVAAWFHLAASDTDGLSMGDYGPEKQREWAEQLVTGLNTHDVNQVPVLRSSGQLLDAQRGTVEAAMPAPGCSYRLLSVQDRGEQGRRPVPGLRTENSTYRFDMTVDEHCSGTTRTRVLGVMAVAEMGYWDPFYFVV
ncbi:hypothetical protein H7K14_20250 [Mycolicibacter longobardus]|uniref:hypothetical protein n=1 Tax=Mycolicibacter longobardus TaxID=1108812 RepID=UPI0021F267AA|nr:hypothetical protein [Mycolicibacter longobardus]MCV7386147.1 hypothetical protein [Mycolicibacter longobardus]